MTTDFNPNNTTILVSGALRPTIKDMPTDIRTRIETLADITTIPMPFVGMIVFVKDIKKFYKIEKLNSTQTKVETEVNGGFKPLLDEEVSAIIANLISSGSIKTELDKKADKSTTYTKTEVNALIDGVNSGDVDLTGYYTKTETDNKLNTKVDKVAGKQLSTEDFTTTEKNKLATLQNADVTKSYVDTELAKKLNSAGHVLTDNNYTTAEKTKLAGLNNYTHPSTHPATIIAQDANNRFVTDTEKSTWNSKVSTTTTINSKPLSSNVVLTLDDISDGSTRQLATYQAKTDNTLTTTNKTVVGAINENKTQLDNIVTDLQGHLDSHPNGGLTPEQELNVNKVPAIEDEVNAIKPKVPEPITYEQWLALTQEEKDNGYWAVIDFPDETPTDLSLNGSLLKLKKADGTEIGTGVTLPSGEGTGSTNWTEITGIPSTFPPSAHRHDISQIDNLNGGGWDGILTSANGTKYRVIVGDDGTLSTQAIVIYGEIIVSTNTLSVNENAINTFTVTLDKAPTSEQVISLSVDNSNCTLSISQLTFNSTNFSNPQTVTVTGVHDSSSYENKTTIVTCSNDNVDDKTINVTIANIDVSAVTNVVVTPDVAMITSIGGTQQLTATIEPSTATNKAVTWTSNDTNIATVDNAGKVTSKANGSCIITCTAQDTTNNASDICNVTVSGSESTDVLTTTDFTLGSTGTITIDYNQLSFNNIYIGIPLEKLNKFTSPNTLYMIEYEIIENTFTHVLKDNTGATIFPAAGATTIAYIGQVGKITFSKTTISSPNFENSKTQAVADNFLRLQVSESFSTNIQSGTLKLKIRVFLK